MTSGTKLFLAVFALCIGIMVVYYGVMTPTGPGRTAASALNTKPRANEPEVLPRMPLETANATATGSDSSLSHQATSVAIPPRDLLQGLPLVHVASPSPRPSPAPAGTHEAAAGAAGTQGAVAGPVLPNEPASITAPITNAGSAITNASSALPKPADSGRLTDKTTILSANRPVATGTSNLPVGQEYVVKSGDTLSSIAGEWFNDESKWSLIARANPSVDPSRMQIGQKLKLPPKDATPEPVKASVVAESSKPDKNTYIVKSGDSLAKIAREFYNNVAMWEKVYEANKATIGSDPAALKVGMKLVMPKADKPAPRSN